MVYYQYDEAAFRAEQYGQGYFDYKTDSFGDVVETEDELFDSLRRIFNNDLQPDEVYLKKINSFFKFNDTENCRRVYDAISSLL